MSTDIQEPKNDDGLYVLEILVALIVALGLPFVVIWGVL